MSTSYVSNYPASGYASELKLKEEFEKIETALRDTISRSNSGTGSNAMAADLDLGGNDILNVNTIDVQSVISNGQDYTSVIEAERVAAEAARDAAQLSESNASSSAGDSAYSAQEAKDHSVFLKEFLDDYAQDILNFPLDLGFITDAPVTASYDLGELL